MRSGKRLSGFAETLCETLCGKRQENDKLRARFSPGSCYWDLFNSLVHTRKKSHAFAYTLIWPVPLRMYFVEQSSFRPTGPRAWSFCVEMPISQPKPNSPPSVKRVEAFA